MSRCCPAAPEPQRSSTSKTSAIPKPHSWSATTTTGQDSTPPRLNGSGSPFNIHPQPEIQYRMKTTCDTPLRHCHTSNFSLLTTAARSHRQARTHSKFTPTLPCCSRNQRILTRLASKVLPEAGSPTGSHEGRRPHDHESVCLRKSAPNVTSLLTRVGPLSCTVQPSALGDTASAVVEIGDVPRRE